jgi:nucleoside-diphosphate-sugar epimerase
MNSTIRNKTVLVTGATGFIGSHLTRRLLSERADVHILLKKKSNPFRIKDIAGDITLSYGDIRDCSDVSLCLKSVRPQIIFHLAALRNVKRDPELIEQMIDINLKGTINLLRGVIEENINIECFVSTGSSEEYGDGPTPFNEDQREIPVSPYSASKVAATYFSQMLCKTMHLPVVTLRPLLTYGPYQDTDMFIPALIQHCLERKDFPMTEGDQTREFNYVDDIVDAYLLAAVSPEAAGEVINIGNGIEYRIRDVAEMIVRMTGNPIQLKIGALPKRPGETKHFFCNNEKAKRLLGWSPKTDLNEGLKKTIDWYRNVFSKNFFANL